MKILITGGATGIGFETAKYLAARNHKVVIGAFNQEQIHVAKTKCSSQIDFIKLDVTNPKDREGLQDLEIDCLIQNAGIGIGGSIADINMEKVRRTFETNVFSQFEIMQIVLPGMMKRKNGRIVIISSLLGEMPMKFFGVYSASKAALVMLSTALKRELKALDSGVSVCLIEPGMYHTGFNQRMINEKFDWMKENSWFKNQIPHLKKYQNGLFHLFEKKNIKPIARKIVRAAEGRRFRYRAPFSQAFGVKLYQIFIK